MAYGTRPHVGPMQTQADFVFSGPPWVAFILTPLGKHSMRHGDRNTPSQEYCEVHKHVGAESPAGIQTALPCAAAGWPITVHAPFYAHIRRVATWINPKGSQVVDLIIAKLYDFKYFN